MEGEGRDLGAEGESTQPAGRHARLGSWQMRKDVTLGGGGRVRVWRCPCLEGVLPLSPAVLPGGAGPEGPGRLLGSWFLLVLMEHGLPLPALWAARLLPLLIRDRAQAHSGRAPGKRSCLWVLERDAVPEATGCGTSLLAALQLSSAFETIGFYLVLQKVVSK